VRKTPFADNEYYHIFNRGVEKRDIFSDDRDYQRFFLSLVLMNDEKEGLMIRWRNYQASQPNATVEKFLRSNLSEKKPLVKIISYCLNPNHYHFILKQIRNRGIEKFMQRIATGYTMYFNKKYKRSGVLFQGKFKSSHIKSNSQLLRMSVYVNCNSEIHGISPARNYKWCSFPEYIGRRQKRLCCTKVIMSHFKDVRDYENYALENTLDFKEQKEDEKTMLLE
jgi:putative transposase